MPPFQWRDRYRRAHGTILLSSHILAIVERVATQIAILRDGRISWNSTANPLPSTLEELYFELAEQPRMEDPGWLGRP